VTLQSPYIYNATVLYVHDGDTFDADVDFGFYLHHAPTPVRLLGCNARELSEPGGTEARDNLAALLPAGSRVLLQTAKPDKYAPRWDAQVTYLTGDGAVHDLVTDLIADEWAAEWDGKGSPPVPPWPRP
jgi:endonuclease YncB( thermonuclease family)